MKKLIVTTMILSLIVLGTGNFLVEAQMGPKVAGQGYRMHNTQSPYDQQNDFNVLNLEEEQLDQIEDLRDDFFDQREEVIEELSEKRLSLREAILEGLTEQEIADLETELAELQNQLTELRTEHLKNMRNVLDEEQINMLLENEYRIGLRSNFGPRQGNFHVQSRPFRSFRGMTGFNRTPVRGYCH